MLRTNGLILSIPIFLTLTGCAPLAAMLGYGGPVIQIAAQLDQIKLMADGISYLDSGKTVSDHVISAATGSDCKMTNILDRAPVCVSASPEKPSTLATN